MESIRHCMFFCFAGVRLWHQWTEVKFRNELLRMCDDELKCDDVMLSKYREARVDATLFPASIGRECLTGCTPRCTATGRKKLFGS